MIYKNITETIGKTPLIKLGKIKKIFNLYGDIIALYEGVNPAGSIKDRVGLKMIEDYEKLGKINKDTVIIEPTSGNTGIGLALVCAQRGYKLKIVMPDNMSKERILLMRAYGAEVILTDGKNGMQGAIDKANDLCKEIEGSIIAGQFDNLSNPEAHYLTTGPQIYEATDGKIDFLVCGVGTGGTITGTGKYLKEKNPNIKVIAIEPNTSAVLSGDKKGPHGLQGIGAGFIPSVLDTSIYDEIIRVSDKDAFDHMKLLATEEGILSGISSGASLYGAIEIAKRKENEGKQIVVVLPDTGTRYLSSL